MTTSEARYVLEHWREYDAAMVAWAREIVELADRPGRYDGFEDP